MRISSSRPVCTELEYVRCVTSPSLSGKIYGAATVAVLYCYVAGKHGPFVQRSRAFCLSFSNAVRGALAAPRNQLGS